MYGLRGDRDLPNIFVFRASEGTTIHAPKITLILRPQPTPVDQHRLPALLRVSATNGSSAQATIDAPLIVDFESFADEPNSEVERAKGITVYTDVSGKSSLTLLGPTAIRAIDGNTRTGLPPAAQSVRALTTESWDGGSSELFVKNKLLIYAETPRAHMLPAVDVNDSNSAQRGSLVVFDADAQVNTVGRLGGTLMAFRSRAESSEAVKSVQTIQSTAGHHLKFTSETSNGSSRTEVSGSAAFSSNFAQTIIDHHAQVTLSATTDAGTAYGFLFYPKTNSKIDATFRGPLTTSATATTGTAYGGYVYNAASQVLRLNNAELAATTNGTQKAYGLYVYNLKEATLSSSDRLKVSATSTNADAYGAQLLASFDSDIGVKASSAATLNFIEAQATTGEKTSYALNFSAQSGSRQEITIGQSALTAQSQKIAYGMYLKAEGTDSQNAVKVTSTSTMTAEAPSTSHAVYLLAKTQGRNKLELNGLTSTSSTSVATLSSQSGGKNELTLKGLVNVTTAISYPAFLVKTDNADGSEATLSLEGTTNIEQDTLFFARGKNAQIRVAPRGSGLHHLLKGSGYASNGGTLEVDLADGLTSDLWLSNIQPPSNTSTSTEQPVNTVNVKVSDRAVWRMLDKTTPSTIDTLELASNGVVDFSTTGTDKGTAALVVNDLKGDGGVISLDVHTEDNTAHILKIMNSSAGRHQIVVKNNAAATATGQPILVVESVNSDTEPGNYTAEFWSDDIVVGELTYHVGKATTVNRDNNPDATDEAAEENATTGGTPNARRAPVRRALALANSSPEATASEEAATNSSATGDTPEEPAAEPTEMVPSTHPEHWYLYTRPAEPVVSTDPEPHFNDPARGLLGTHATRYLAAIGTQETLRQRLGDIHQFSQTDEGYTPWVRMNTREYRMGALSGVKKLDLTMQSVRGGVDKRLSETDFLGGFFGYAWINSVTSTPAKLHGKSFDVGAYWTHLTEGGTYWDIVGRVGRTESRMDAKEPDGAAVKAKKLHGNFASVSAEVGHRFSLTDTIKMEPMAQAVYTHFGKYSARTDSGLRARAPSFESLLTRVGSTLEAHRRTAGGTPWTFYAKVHYEREWLAHPDMTFNESNAYPMDYRAAVGFMVWA